MAENCGCKYDAMSRVPQEPVDMTAALWKLPPGTVDMAESMRRLPLGAVDMTASMRKPADFTNMPGLQAKDCGCGFKDGKESGQKRKELRSGRKGCQGAAPQITSGAANRITPDPRRHPPVIQPGAPAMCVRSDLIHGAANRILPQKYGLDSDLHVGKTCVDPASRGMTCGQPALGLSRGWGQPALGLYQGLMGGYGQPAMGLSMAVHMNRQTRQDSPLTWTGHPDCISG